MNILISCGDVIPIATQNKILDTLRNHLELENVEALSQKLDHGSKIKNSPITSTKSQTHLVEPNIVKLNQHRQKKRRDRTKIETKTKEPNRFKNKQKIDAGKKGIAEPKNMLKNTRQQE